MISSTGSLPVNTVTPRGVSTSSGERRGTIAVTGTRRAWDSMKCRAVLFPDRGGPVIMKPLPPISGSKPCRARLSPPTPTGTKARLALAGSRSRASRAEMVAGRSSTRCGRRDRGRSAYRSPASRPISWSTRTWSVPTPLGSSSPHWTSRGRSPARKARPGGIEAGTSRAGMPMLAKSPGSLSDSAMRSSMSVLMRPTRPLRSEVITTRMPTPAPSWRIAVTRSRSTPPSTDSKDWTKPSQRSRSTTR